MPAGGNPPGPNPHHVVPLFGYADEPGRPGSLGHMPSASFRGKAGPNPSRGMEQYDGGLNPRRWTDECVEIPMGGVGSSLNVAVAGSLVLYRLAGMS